LYTLFLYLEVWIILSLTYEFVGFSFFETVTYSQDCSAPEEESSLLPKRRVCVISDGGKNPNTHQ
jgi:hypothetical protein